MQSEDDRVLRRRVEDDGSLGPLEPAVPARLLEDARGDATARGVVGGGGRQVDEADQLPQGATSVEARPAQSGGHAQGGIVAGTLVVGVIVARALGVGVLVAGTVLVGVFVEVTDGVGVFVTGAPGHMKS